MSLVRKLIEIVYKINFGFNYYYHSTCQKLTKSWVYHFIVSRWSGISIGEKDHQTIKIKYIFEGKEYEVWIPFERKLVSKMLNQTVQVIQSNDEIKIIRQQPGVPYLITPGHLGGSSGLLLTICKEKEIHKDEKFHIY